jgi:rare lipoprotein A
LDLRSARCVGQRVRSGSVKLITLLCAVVFSSSCLAEEYYGVSSWYHNNNKTAQGKRFDPDKYSVAHRTLPFGTMLRLTNVKNGNTIEAVVNDRGPFVRNKELDVSSSAAKALGFFHSGTAKLLIEVLDRRQ